MSRSSPHRYPSGRLAALAPAIFWIVVLIGGTQQPAYAVTTADAVAVDGSENLQNAQTASAAAAVKGPDAPVSTERIPERKTLRHGASDRYATFGIPDAGLPFHARRASDVCDLSDPLYLIHAALLI